MVETLAPGASKEFQVVSDYRDSIAAKKENVAIVQFCVSWNREWLRKSTYLRYAYDWNESFELCREVRVVSE